ncbi:MAG TPA: DinB family protein [Thermomicrobiales bacterium]|nr:DinB family protein [Thermomicrobiales bacterium]
MNDALVNLFDHNRWANLRLIDACAGLDDGQLGASVAGGYGALGDTLVHLVAAEGRYVAGLGDRSGRARAVSVAMPFPGFAALRDHAAWSGGWLIDFAATIEGDPIVEDDWSGAIERLPTSLLLTQAINHATEHRAQIATILTQLGIAPPEMDGWTWGFEKWIAADAGP